MAKGMSRRSGPPPDPNSLTQVSGEWLVLPASGREGDPPTWPLSDGTSRELELWVREWCRPQAVEWERHGQELEVAMYVRTLVAAEKADAPVALRTLLRQQQEALGVSVPGMQRNRWKLGEVESPASGDGAGRSSARDRLRVVGGGA